VTDRPDVAIVGYGPVGATLANLCGVLGLRAVVLERSTEPYGLPRACHLDAEIMRVFQGAGLGDAVAAVCEPSRGMEYVDAEHRRLFTYEDFERAPVLGWHEDYVFVQPQLEAVLRAGVARFPGVEVRLGVEVTGVTDDGRGRDGSLLATSAGPLPARWVVACDGAASSVRRALGVEQRSLGFDEDWLVVDVMLRREVALPGIIQQICDPARLATFVPSAGAHRRWELAVLPGEDPIDLRAPGRVWKLLSPWCSPADGDLVRAAVYRFHAVVATRWRVGSVFLAGDAAHQMPPFMGQGMCSGIRDVANLAWKLALVARGEAGESLLDTYEAERVPHVERTVELSVEAGRLLHELADATVQGRPPRLPAPDTDDDERWSRLPPLAGGVLDGEPPFPFPVGHQARQPRVGRPGAPPGRQGTVLLDDLCGPRFALVTAGPVGPVEVGAAVPADSGAAVPADSGAAVPADSGAAVPADSGAAVPADPAVPGGEVPGYVRVVDASALDDVDGWVARLLGGRFAVLARPDRYVFGVAATPTDVPALLTRLRAALA
jgi:3-(3-hydroxy-phenyl)propionate hydroxylase